MTAQITSLPYNVTAGHEPWKQRKDYKLLSRLSLAQSPGHLPSPMLPTFIQGSMAWSGPDVKQLPILELDKDDETEVDTALSHFQALEVDGDQVSPENFPLPRLEKRLQEAALEVHQGRSFAIIRGLNPARYSVEDNAIIFLGISSYIGDERGLQDSKGNMLSHVTEAKSWSRVPQASRHGIHTNASLPFHSDMGCEILALHVRGCAKKGGRTIISPAATIFNDLAASDRTALQTLTKPSWPVQLSRQGLYTRSPLLDFHAGNLLVASDQSRLGRHPATPPSQRAPELTPEQRIALGVFQAAAERHQLPLNHQVGDLVYLNNLALVHAREAYRDGDDDDSTFTVGEENDNGNGNGMESGKGSRRHLVRLWLRNTELSWPIPLLMREPWETTFGARAQKVVDRNYPLAPMPEYVAPKYSNGTAAFVVEDDDDERQGRKGNEEGGVGRKLDVFYDDVEGMLVEEEEEEEDEM